MCRAIANSLRRGLGAIALALVFADGYAFADPSGEAVLLSDNAFLMQLSGGSDAANRASLLQKGELNKAEITQSENSQHLLIANQLGARNSLNVAQSGIGGANLLGLVQSGQENHADIYQDGVENQAAIVQRGDGNDLRLVQEGGQNSIAMAQFGDQLTLSIRQTGTMSMAITQTGF